MRGRALIIATSRYSDPELSPLPSVMQDAAGLREVLADPRIGGFVVTECRDSPYPVWRERIVEFFSKASADEMLLLYISGHGLKDQPGRLYFAATDTRQSQLAANGIPSSFIHEQANGSRSRRVVMIFDTCFSGAFASGWELKDGSRPDNPPINVGHYFQEATGRVVIAASDRMQRALAGKEQPSLFTKHLIEGLRTGKADMDGDGEVSSAELVAYVAEKMRSETEAQEPKRWAFELAKGIDLVIASNPRPRPGKLTQELIDLIMSTNAKVRLVAVEELRALVGSAPSVPVVLAARQALEGLREDDSKAVSSAAAAVLQKAAEPEHQVAPDRESEHQRQATGALLAEDVRRAAAARQAGQEQQAAAARHAEREPGAVAESVIITLEAKLAHARIEIQEGRYLYAAHSYLNEVLRDGSASQKRDAQRLMETLQPLIAARKAERQAADEREAESMAKRKDKRGRRAWAFGIAALLAVGGGAYWLISVLASKHPPTPAVATTARALPTEGNSSRSASSSAVSTIAGHRAGESFRDCADCPEMIVIPPGKFKMGSPDDEPGHRDNEAPVHDVRIDYAFAVGKYPVTRGEWEQFVKEKGHDYVTHCVNGLQDNHPMVCVASYEARAYAAWLSRKSGQHYRLLSEAEYEYVNRAGRGSAYFWGDKWDCRRANNGIASCNGGYKDITPVGSFPQNAFGLYDTTGNVYSWTEDCWHDNYNGAPTDGSAWDPGVNCSAEDRVVRGGSWNSSPSWLRSASRGGKGESGDSGVGFRLARDSSLAP
jgi:formylglycine-generating enzyme required for sulfatase activity